MNFRKTEKGTSHCAHSLHVSCNVLHIAADVENVFRYVASERFCRSVRHQSFAFFSIAGDRAERLFFAFV